MNFDLAQLTVNGATSGTATLTFTSANGNTPQVVTVKAVDDLVRQGPHFSRITQQVSSSDAQYTNLVVPFVDVSIADDDAAGVLVRQTDGSTDVIESDGVAGNTAAPFVDTYSIVLTSPPTSNVTVDV